MLFQEKKDQNIENKSFPRIKTEITTTDVPQLMLSVVRKKGEANFRFEEWVKKDGLLKIFKLGSSWSVHQT